MSLLKKMREGELDVFIAETREEMGRIAAEDAARRLNKIIADRGEANAVFAAAPSQNEFLDSLLRQNIDWSKVNAFHMDEYIGLDPAAPQGFGNFLKAAIFGKVAFKSVHYINGHVKDPQSSCDEYAALLKKYPPDIVFLGIGENGHLAFNDPGVADFNDPFLVKIVELDSVCRNQQVNDGCFKSLNEVPLYAITLTMPMLMSIKEAVAIVPGPTKAEAVYRTLKAEITTDCPATILRRHKSAALYTDRQGGAKIL